MNYIYEDQLESKRLITRRLTLEDVSIWKSFFEDEESTQFIPDFGEINSEEKAERMIEKQIERYSENRFGHQALIDKETNEFIGVCGLLTQIVDGKEEIEVGYHVLKQFWGNGYAPEAAKLFIDYARKNTITTSIISVIDIDNFKSQRVAQKNGLTIDKQTTFMDLDVFIYRLKLE